jgi:hypothetical protein
MIMLTSGLMDYSPYRRTCRGFVQKLPAPKLQVKQVPDLVGGHRGIALTSSVTL